MLENSKCVGEPDFSGLASPLSGCTACTVARFTNIQVLVCTFLEQQYIVREVVPPCCTCIFVDSSTVRNPTFTSSFRTIVS